jgi:2-polyprenyl-6-methoxyphenol hydroxylase-like FAD-dependent oxidoreductase
VTTAWTSARALGAEVGRIGPAGALPAAVGADIAPSTFLDAEPGVSYSVTEVGRAAALASVDGDRLVAFFIRRTGGRLRFGTVEDELRTAFAGAGWHVLALLDLLRTARDVYLDDAAQVVMPRCSDGRGVLLGDAAFAVFLTAGQGASLAMAGAVVLADALAGRPDRIEDASAAYEARFRPWVDVAQRMAKLNVHLFTPANQRQVVAREACCASPRGRCSRLASGGC